MFSLLVSVLALILAGYLAKYVLHQRSGMVERQHIAAAIREGAEAFLKRQYRTISLMTLDLAVLMFILDGSLLVMAPLLFSLPRNRRGRRLHPRMTRLCQTNARG